MLLKDNRYQQDKTTNYDKQFMLAGKMIFVCQSYKI